MSRVEIIGDATLYLGDCADVLPTLTPVASVIGDPPFSIPHNFSIQKGRKGKRALSFEWDKSIDVVGVVNRFELAAELAQSVFVFCGLRQATPLAEMLSAKGFTDKLACWVKKCPTPPAPGNWWPSGFELAVYGYRPGAHFHSADNARSNVFYADSYRFGQPGKVDHPTQKPLGMMGEIVEPMTPVGGTVLDPFMGSGTTGVAALRLGRKFVGVEINPDFFRIACERMHEAWQQPRLLAEPPPPTPTQGKLGI